ncbi:MAG: hypothetical protein ACI8RZ_005724 [Myxococcota bacterium]|jgi:hypothetical protein
MQAYIPRTVKLIPAYLLLACFSTWPAAVRIGSAVPGAGRTDIWNSLWSLWFAQYNFALKGLSLETTLISFPRGGRLMVADPLASVLVGPLIPFLGVSVSYTLLVLGQLVLAGVVAHRFVEEILESRGEERLGAGWIAGVAFATAPVLLTGIHNGTSESFSGGWTALAIWMAWRAARFGGFKRVIIAALFVVLGSVASWYSAMIVFLFLGAMLLLSPAGGFRTNLGARVGVLALSLVLVAPLAYAVQHTAIHPDNLVSIKNVRELMGIRRSTGPADILGFFAPGDFRSPDFRTLSRYGEEFFHCHYLGFVLIFGALYARRRGPAWLWVGGLLAGVFALGPVLVRGGMPLIILTDRAIPLPYFLFEGFPGFGSLSLLYRLTMGLSLALAVLAGIGLSGKRWWLVVGLMLVEGQLLSPLAGLPDVSDSRVSSALVALEDAPHGAVMNFPVAGGRGYLYEQTVHRKPVTDTLNFPNNLASRKVWQAMLDHGEDSTEEFTAYVSSVARREGVRYLVVHEDEEARPDMHDMAVRSVRAAYTPINDADGVQVFQLW